LSCPLLPRSFLSHALHRDQIARRGYHRQSPLSFAGSRFSRRRAGRAAQHDRFDAHVASHRLLPAPIPHPAVQRPPLPSFQLPFSSLSSGVMSRKSRAGARHTMRWRRRWAQRRCLCALDASCVRLKSVAGRCIRRRGRGNRKGVRGAAAAVRSVVVPAQQVQLHSDAVPSCSKHVSAWKHSASDGLLRGLRLRPLRRRTRRLPTDAPSWNSSAPCSRTLYLRNVRQHPLLRRRQQRQHQLSKRRSKISKRRCLQLPVTTHGVADVARSRMRSCVRV
jgi:hypothetical protein